MRDMERYEGERGGERRMREIGFVLWWWSGGEAEEAIENAIAVIGTAID